MFNANKFNTETDLKNLNANESEKFRIGAEVGREAIDRVCRYVGIGIKWSSTNEEEIKKWIKKQLGADVYTTTFEFEYLHQTGFV